jgi:hypothetical protein
MADLSLDRSSACQGVPVMQNRFVIGPRLSDGPFHLVRMPDGLALTARSWDDVWAACPEFNVPWRAVGFSDSVARKQVLDAWGHHPDMRS